jgi:hypothetical protein
MQRLPLSAGECGGPECQRRYDAEARATDGVSSRRADSTGAVPFALQTPGVPQCARTVRYGARHGMSRRLWRAKDTIRSACPFETSLKRLRSSRRTRPAHLSHICTGTALTLATSAPGLPVGSPAATSAPGLGTPARPISCKCSNNPTGAYCRAAVAIALRCASRRSFLLKQRRVRVRVHMPMRTLEFRCTAVRLRNRRRLEAQTWEG